MMAGLPQGARLVLLALWARARPGDDEPEVWPSRERIAADTGMTERNVRRRLTDLEAAGALTRVAGTRIRLHRTTRSAPGGHPMTLRSRPDPAVPGPYGPDRTLRSASPDPTVRQPDPTVPQTQSEHSGEHNIERALASRISDQERPRAVRPRGADDETQPWRAVLTEASMLTPPGARPVRPGGKRPPEGLIDVIDRLGVRGTVGVLSQYAAYCRRHPEQARWWSWGMFTARRWDVVERLAAEMEAPAKQESWADEYLRKIREEKTVDHDEQTR